MTGAPLDLTLLTYAHDARMLEINRACPVVADLTFYFERAPRFFAWPDAVIGADYVYVGGFDGPDLVAYGMFGTVAGQLPWGDAFSYAGDVRVLPACRGRGFVQAAYELVAGSMPDSGVGLALVKQGNEAAAGALGALSRAGATLSPLCEFRAVNLLLLRRLAPPRRFEVRRAREEDLPALVALQQRAYRDRPFAPSVDEGVLRRDCARLPGFALDRYYLAFDRGALVGAVGAWDAGAVRRIAVISYSRRAALLRAAHRAARVAYRSAPPLPSPGDCFRAITLTRLAVPDGDPAVLRDLLAAVYRDALEGGYHLIHAGFAGADPLERATRGFLRQVFRSDLIVIAARARAEALRSGPPPYVDLRYL